MEHDTCVICLTDFSRDATEKTRALTCDHEFHDECLEKWLNEKKTCPLCREDLGIPRPVDRVHSTNQIDQRVTQISDQLRNRNAYLRPYLFDNVQHSPGVIHSFNSNNEDQGRARGTNGYISTYQQVLGGEIHTTDWLNVLHLNNEYQNRGLVTSPLGLFAPPLRIENEEEEPRRGRANELYRLSYIDQFVERTENEIPITVDLVDLVHSIHSITIDQRRTRTGDQSRNSYAYSHLFDNDNDQRQNRGAVNEPPAFDVDLVNGFYLNGPPRRRASGTREANKTREPADSVIRLFFVSFWIILIGFTIGKHGLLSMDNF